MNESPSTERKAWEAPELTDLSITEDTLAKGIGGVGETTHCAPS